MKDKIFDPGMNLRDWFAGQALTAMGDVKAKSAEQMPQFCYMIADAMMEARNERNKI